MKITKYYLCADDSWVKITASPKKFENLGPFERVLGVKGIYIKQYFEMNGQEIPEVAREITV